MPVYRHYPPQDILNDLLNLETCHPLKTLLSFPLYEAIRTTTILRGQILGFYGLWINGYCITFIWAYNYNCMNHNKDITIIILFAASQNCRNLYYNGFLAITKVHTTILALCV